MFPAGHPPLLHLHLHQLTRIDPQDIHYLNHDPVGAWLLIHARRTGEFQLPVLLGAERLPLVLEDVVARPVLFDHVGADPAGRVKTDQVEFVAVFGYLVQVNDRFDGFALGEIKLEGLILSGYYVGVVKPVFEQSFTGSGSAFVSTFPLSTDALPHFMYQLR